MDQGRLRLILGLILYICLAIGLIIFAILTVKGAKSIGSVEQLRTIQTDEHKRVNKTEETDIHDRLHAEHEILTETTTSTTTASTVTSTTSGMCGETLRFVEI